MYDPNVNSVNEGLRAYIMLQCGMAHQGLGPIKPGVSPLSRADLWPVVSVVRVVVLCCVWCCCGVGVH